MNQVPDAAEKFHNHVPNILPVSREHGEQGTQMQQYVKKAGDLRSAGLAQQVLRNRQMSGTGNRQKLRHALNQTQ